MQPYAQPALPRCPASITRTRAIGSEAPLRAALGLGERLLVCASVRFSEGTSTQPLWLTERRFLFTRKQGSAKFIVSVPVNGADLIHETGAYPLQLRWMDDSGRPWVTAFRAKTWKDSVTGGSAAASAGVSGGIAGALIGLGVDAGISALVRKRESPSRDEELYSILTAAMRTPTDVRPVDLTSGSLGTVAGRILIGSCLAIPTALLIGFSVFAFLGYQTKQAYEQAPICGTSGGSDCRLLQPAVVTSFRGAAGKNAYCDLWLRKADGSTVEADLHTYGLCARRPLSQHMSLEYWRGSLTAVVATGVAPADSASEETADNPEYNWRWGSIMAGICGLLFAIFGTAATAEVISWKRRRSLLQASARLAGYLG